LDTTPENRGIAQRVFVPLLCIVVADDGQINRLDATPFFALYAGFTAYLVGLVRQQMNEREVQEFRNEVKELAETVQRRPRTWLCLTFIVTGVALLGAGAHATVSGAV
jgi:hypothetical protein